VVFYSESAAERTITIQEVIFWAMAKKITRYQAAEIIGIIDRQMRRRCERYREFGVGHPTNLDSQGLGF